MAFGGYSCRDALHGQLIDGVRQVHRCGIGLSVGRLHQVVQRDDVCAECYLK
ncbi:hypothetical protein L6472_12660 [Prevotella sp. E13-17]|uniref:hypothetical protein n=1 Tax=Prevotella sp. E13-17 TaxID=2913616 RepID=UPI001EDBFAFF|nr:hypothetical protein [Prevotella sp. E13-17]UKK50844.1 hypothetical protein L6472_12660 [Prevotella sp. E13-17]